jgi:ABC-type transporter Mla subunit MlaD
MSSSGFETMQMVILVLVAIALLVNSALVVILLVGLGKLGKTVKDEVSDLRESVMPMIRDTRDLLTNISPKVEAATDDLSAILHTLRSQTAAFESVSEEVVDRFRKQAQRMEGVLSGLISTADVTGNAVAETVSRPIRKIAGLVASARAVVETLRAPAPTVQARRDRDNRDMLV